MLNKDIKIIEKEGLIIVLDVNSGSIHLFDEEGRDALLKYMQGGKPGDAEEAEAFEEIELLVAEGSLLTKDDGSLPRNINHQLKSICLNVAHICNLACPYCFASGGNYKGSEALMTPEVGRKAIDYLLENSRDRAIVEVDFFGGEPLLNFSLIRDLVAYGEEQSKAAGKAIKWSMTTNGVLLDEEVSRFLVAHDIGTVLSIDGRKEIHDASRYFKNGRGSYDQVVGNYLKFKDETQDYVARGTYTSKNLDFYKDVEILKELGFNHLSLEPVIGGDLTVQDLDAIRESYDELARLYLKWLAEKKPLDFFHFNINLKGGPCIYKRITACGAGFEYLAITPAGDIYPCHQLIENPEYRMGNILEGGFREDISGEFLATNIYTKEQCRNCWARFYCSGGCHANNLKYGGGLQSPYDLGCEIQKIRLETALYVQARKLLDSIGEEDFKNSDLITKEKINELLQ